METVDREVLSVLIYQQWMEATEHAHWDEAAMALYKLQKSQTVSHSRISSSMRRAPCGVLEAA